MHGAKLDRLQERQHLTVDFRTVPQRVNVGLRGLQVAIHLHTTVCFCASAMRQRGFRAQPCRGNHHIDLHAAVAVKRCANAAFGFAQTLQLRFQQQMHAHVSQTVL